MLTGCSRSLGLKIAISSVLGLGNEASELLMLQPDPKTSVG